MKKKTAGRKPSRTAVGNRTVSVSRAARQIKKTQDTITLPEIKKLTVTIVTDNYCDAIRPEAAIGKRHRGGPGASINAQHGLSFYIETASNGKSHAFMFDYGSDAQGVIKNMDLLDIDLRKIKAFGLSHGHFDHWKGLVDVLKHNRSKIPRNTPLYIGGETFAHRYSVDPSGNVLDLGQLKRKDIEDLGVVKIMEISEPTEAVPGCWLTGDIERVTEYEKGAPTLHIKRGGKLERDYLEGEQAIVVNVKGKGLVVISGCAHAGIINTVKHAQKATGIRKVHAIIGGFHLVNAKPETIERTLADIKKIAPDYIIPTHCTGFEAMVLFAKEMPKQFILNTAGAQYVFEA